MAKGDGRHGSGCCVLFFLLTAGSEYVPVGIVLVVAVGEYPRLHHVDVRDVDLSLDQRQNPDAGRELLE